MLPLNVTLIVIVITVPQSEYQQQNITKYLKMICEQKGMKYRAGVLKKEHIKKTCQMHSWAGNIVAYSYP